MWAELWALRLGIRVARELSLQQDIFELDSKVIVDMIHKKETRIGFLQPLLQEILELLLLPSWRTSVVHAFREANKCADLLANMGHSTSYEGVFFSTSFPSLSLLIQADVQGVCTPRIVS